MGGPKVSRFFCSMCDANFPSKKALLQHQANHPEPEPAKHNCETCNWPFDDSLALENHYMASGHGVLPFPCDNCSKRFLSEHALNEHRKSCAKPVQCRNCSVIFPSEAAYNKHRRFPSPCADGLNKPAKTKDATKKPAFVDVDAPARQATVLCYEDEKSLGRSRTPSDVEGIYCHGCKSSFESQARYDRHLLWCVTRSTTINTGTTRTTRLQAEVISSENVHPSKTMRASGHNYPQKAQSLAEASRPLQPATTMYAALHHALPASKQAVPSSQMRPKSAMQSQPKPSLSIAPPVTNRSPIPASSNPSAQASNTGKFPCNLRDCKRVCNSAAALEAHQQDVHGVGRKHPTLPIKKNGILKPRAQEQLRSHGLLQPSVAGPQGYRPAPPSSPRLVPQSGPRIAFPPPRPAPTAKSPLPMGLKASVAARPAMTRPPPPPAATGHAVGGQAEFDQANLIYGKIARLRIQSDITIQHDGKMICGGIAWTRIGVAKQVDVVGMLDKYTHLPAKLQAKEYLPAPKTFKDDYRIHYPADDFQHSPDRLSGNPGLGVVALSCSKIVLHNGRQEAVKVAVIDVLSCRILMNFLVWTDPKAPVKDWRPRVTGLTNIGDVEAARQNGYKVLKGWQAARAAVWKFIDKETIIVGYNLRADLDALRMIHGRAVDIAKSVEKAAAGPLSRAQLSLDSLCRDYPGVILKPHATFGRDCLLDAFAVREFGLWMLKQGDELVKKAKAKSRDYQILHPA